MGRFAKQFFVLFSETAEVPEAQIESNIRHRGRARPFPQEITMGTIQPDAAEIRGRSHADSVLERTIESSSRHFASSANFGHRRRNQARFPHGPINPAHHCSSPLVRSIGMRGEVLRGGFQEITHQLLLELRQGVAGVAHPRVRLNNRCRFRKVRDDFTSRGGRRLKHRPWLAHCILKLRREPPDVFGKNLIANGEASDLGAPAINPVVFRPGRG